LSIQDIRANDLARTPEHPHDAARVKSPFWSRVQTGPSNPTKLPLHIAPLLVGSTASSPPPPDDCRKADPPSEQRLLAAPPSGSFRIGTASREWDHGHASQHPGLLRYEMSWTPIAPSTPRPREAGSDERAAPPAPASRSGWQSRDPRTGSSVCELTDLGGRSSHGLERPGLLPG
jgi:hypothetical protein